MIDTKNIPQHIAIIMDGNGRWAKEKGLPRSRGHREGAKRVEELLKIADKMGIRFLTFFAFSTENWKRPRVEVDMLMRLLHNFLGRNIKMMKDNGIRFIVIGRRKPTPDYLWEKLIKAQEETKGGKGLTVILAFNYGARQEIIDAIKKVVDNVLDKRLSLRDIDEENFNKFLYTRDIPDPDLLIRTSGELRISNFLLWQLSYAELYFPTVYWPDFKRENLEEAVLSYQSRSRRFGAI